MNNNNNNNNQNEEDILIIEVSIAFMNFNWVLNGL